MLDVPSFLPVERKKESVSEARLGASVDAAPPPPTEQPVKAPSPASAAPAPSRVRREIGLDVSDTSFPSTDGSGASAQMSAILVKVLIRLHS